jgi:membrane-associated protease RseP (regulator of RpoE activity)
VWRDGKGRDVKITVGERSADMEWTPKADPGDQRSQRRVVRVAPGAPHAMWFEGDGDDPRRMVMRVESRPRLGVQLQDLNSDLAEALGVKGKGVLVTEVVDDTPAEKAGLKAGDVITRVDGKIVEDSGDLRSALREAEGEVSVTVVRRGQTRNLTADVGRKPEAQSWTWSGQAVDPDRIRMDIQKSLKGMEGLDEELKKELEGLKKEIRELQKEVEGMKNSR